jgi:hypothetical protein
MHLKFPHVSNISEISKCVETITTKMAIMFDKSYSNLLDEFVEERLPL